MITQERLHELFDYREDGNLIRKVSTSNRVKIGDVAGHLYKDRYCRVQIDDRKIDLHRMIFLYHHGYLTPGMDIDHIDGNKVNNRIENLREVTRSQNLQNSKTPCTNTSGIKGVCWNKVTKKWIAQLSVGGKIKYLGCYNTLEGAESAVKEGREKYHGEYARHE